MVELSLLLTITTLMLVVSIYFEQKITRGVAVAFRAGKATINTLGQGGRQLRQLAEEVAREYSVATPLDFRGFSLKDFSADTRHRCVGVIIYRNFCHPKIRPLRTAQHLPESCRCHTAYNQHFNNHFKEKLYRNVSSLLHKTPNRQSSRIGQAIVCA